MRARVPKLRSPSRTALVTLAGFLSSLLVASLPLRAQSANGEELSTNETEPNYKLEVERNLVQVRVVVRDSKGRTVGNLHKEDFLLFDNGRLQSISHFSVETPQTPNAAPTTNLSKEGEPEAGPEPEFVQGSPQRYLALYFDDIHLPFEDVSRVRKAADNYLASALTPGDRVAVFTASGHGNLDFTADRAELETALLHLHPRLSITQDIRPCPEIQDYQAILMVRDRNPQAIEIGVEETLHCRYQDDRKFLDNARAESDVEALRKMEQFQSTSEASLRGLDAAIRRVSFLPGQRSIVLISPGFLTVTLESRLSAIVDRALRANITISSLDSRGLEAVSPQGGADEQHLVLTNRPDLVGRKQEFQLTAGMLCDQTLRDLAAGTGGNYFHNNNDLQEGFRRVSELPESYYTLAFSPEKLKLDGRFHTLQVKLAKPASLTVEARRGYFAPQHSQKPETQAREQIMQAVFSQESLSEIPLEVHTQFFKQDRLDAILAILAHVDLRFLRFRKADGRNLNNLTVVTALFDQNGNYLQGKERRVDFRLRDTSLEKLAQSGLTMRTNFNVKPGTYMVREVVRDSEGSQISGITRTVEIPF
jgi:VWFA-related protein